MAQLKQSNCSKVNDIYMYVCITEIQNRYIPILTRLISKRQLKLLHE